jgi:hypothetical protein
VLEYLSKDMADVDISAAEITPKFLDHVWSEVEDILKSAAGQRGWARGKTRETQQSSVPKKTVSPASPLSISDADLRPILPLPVLDPDVDMSSTIRTRNAAPQPGSPATEELQKTQKSRNRQPVPMSGLNELELDTARFVLEEMIRKVVEQFRIFTISQVSCPEGAFRNPELRLDPQVSLRRVPHLAKHNMSDPGLWDDFMLLQDNELEYIRLKLYMLAVGIKTYTFLKEMVCFVTNDGGDRPNTRARGGGAGKTKKRIENAVVRFGEFRGCSCDFGQGPRECFWHLGRGGRRGE